MHLLPHSSTKNSNAGLFKLSTKLSFIVVLVPEGFVLLEMEYAYNLQDIICWHNWSGLFHQLHHHCFVINRRFIRARLSQYLRIRLWYQIGPRRILTRTYKHMQTWLKRSNHQKTTCWTWRKSMNTKCCHLYQLGLTLHNLPTPPNFLSTLIFMNGLSTFANVFYSLS